MADPNQTLIHQLGEEKAVSGKVKIPVFVAILVFLIILGVSAGYFLATSPKTTPTDKTAVKGKAKQTVGIFDKKRFPDSAEGTLRKGGIDGEGNFHLVRPGGESQNVYLTSSIVDLSQFIGKKIKVWGETFQGEKAGWLMDVGYVEVL